MKKRQFISSVIMTIAISHTSIGSEAQVSSSDLSESAGDPSLWPELQIKVKPDEKIEKRIQTLLSKMTLEQKVAQIIQPEIRDITVEDMRRYGFGSYLNGGGSFPNGNKHASVDDWVNLAESMYQASMDTRDDGIAIPTMWGTDAVHGHNNVIGATLFPHNIALGATHDPKLIKRIAEATAKEVMATGIDWIFAPTVANAQDERWGRTYESYSEDPSLIRAYAEAIVEGLQGQYGKDLFDETKVISTVKHFIGDGGTVGGDDQGDNIADEKALIEVHGQGYIGGLSAGAQSVMASFNSWHGNKIHGSKYLLTDVLKNRMGFDGFVVGDWNGHGQIEGCTNDNCPDALNAGLDIYMVPTQAWKPLMENLITQVETGVIAQSRLDDAVSRILRVKLRSGLFEKPSPANRPLSGKVELIGAESHRKIAAEAVKKSLVLLKNKDHILPLSPNQTILVAGDGAHNIGKQSGGWSISWQGTGNENTDFPEASSIYQGIEEQVVAAGGKVILSESAELKDKVDVAIVVFGEEPYAEGNGDLDNLEYQRGDKRDLALLQSLKDKGIPVVSIFLSGRPLWTNPEINASDAFVAAWLPGTEGAAISQVIFKDVKGNPQYDFSGRLPFSWPASPFQAQLNKSDPDYVPLLPVGFGLAYGQSTTLTQSLPEDSGEKTTLENISQIPLFVNVVNKPWWWAINSDDEQVKLTSNRYISDEVSVRTTDRQLQEDALYITWHSNAFRSVSLNADFPKDFRPYLEGSWALVFEVLNTEKPQTFQIGMACTKDCDNAVPVEISALENWQTIQIPLQCFKQAGTNLAQVFSSFSIGTQLASEIVISQIRLARSTSSIIESCQ